MHKKIISSSIPDKKNGRPPLGPRANTSNQPETEKKHGLPGNAKLNLRDLLKQKEKLLNRKLEEQKKRLQAESTISLQKSVILEEQFKKEIAEAKAQKLAEKLRALGIDPDNI